jgi:hypothetical protein
MFIEGFSGHDGIARACRKQMARPYPYWCAIALLGSL